MGQDPLVDEQIVAGAKFAAAVEEHYKPVAAAFWLKDSYQFNWHLYLVLVDFDEKQGVRDTYDEILPLLGPHPHPWLGLSGIRVIGTEHPIAKDVIEMQQKYPNQFPKRTRDTRLGGVTIEDGYIYGLPIVETA